MPRRSPVRSRCVAILVSIQAGLMDKLSEHVLLSVDDLAVMGWLLPNCAIGVYYLVLIGRGTAATRFANR